MLRNVALSIVALAMLLRPMADIAAELHLDRHVRAQVAELAGLAGPGIDEHSLMCPQDAQLVETHDLLHQSHSGGAWLDLVFDWVVPQAPLAPALSPAPARPDIPDGHALPVLRPPIA